MRKSKPQALARRERQIMDVLYKLERASVGLVLATLPDRPNYSTVRAQLRVLEEKGHLRHEEEGLRYLYYPTVPRHAVRTSAEVVRSMYDLAGGTAIYDDSPLQRRFRDAHAATAHFQVNPATWELTGRLLLGQPTETAML